MDGTLVLDSLFPGYSLVSRLLVELLGFDVSHLIPLLVLCFGFFKAADYVYYNSRNLLLRFCTCSVVINSDVDAYANMQIWFADKKNFGQRCSDLTALSIKKIVAQSAIASRSQQTKSNSGDVLARKVRNEKLQEFEPMLHTFQWFWHNKRLFIWYRRRQREAEIMPGYMLSSEVIEAKIYCFSWTAQPIKALMAEAASYCDGKRARMTRVRRPASKKARGGDENPWRTAAWRHSRPLSTVILDNSVKRDLVSDIESYLEPETRKWYSQRGIPYRRGYLFYGVPGSGKTSLCFALAGYLDLDIYCVSLAEPSISEEDLVLLFDRLPDPCIVLLEDIDSAGLKKRNTKTILAINNGNDDNDSDADASHETELLGSKDNPEAFVGASRVTLSGLLNVIDGVASQEGRILIMTTNDVDALDKALLRPGRIDTKIKFGMASKANAHDLFVQIFMKHASDSIDETVEIPLSLTAQAEQFALQLPEERLTIAELQGYLLLWKDETPQHAVDNFAAWIEDHKR